jgi:hypothetical protein
MPKFLEDKLKAEYPHNPSAVYGTLNKLGAMHGNQETAKGRAMQAKHNRDVQAGTASPHATTPPRQLASRPASSLPPTRHSTTSSQLHPHKNLGPYLHPKKGR